MFVKMMTDKYKLEYRVITLTFYFTIQLNSCLILRVRNFAYK